MKTYRQLFQKLLNTYGTESMSDVFSDASKPKMSGLTSILENLVKMYTGTGMTDSQKEEIDYGTDAQYELWRKTQSMPAQVAQYKEAGVNPMMLASGSGVGSVPSAGTSSAPSQDILGTILNFALRAKSLQSEIDVRNATAEGMRIENDWKERLNQANYDKILAETGNLKANTAKLFQDTRFAEIYADYAPRLFSMQLSQGDAEIKSKLQAIKESNSRIQVNQADIHRIESVAARNRAQIREINKNIEKLNEECLSLAKSRELTDQQISESLKRMEKMDEEIHLIGKQIGLADKDIQYYVWNHSWNSKVSAFGVSYEKRYSPDEAAFYDNPVPPAPASGDSSGYSPWHRFFHGTSNRGGWHRR